jgi:hypothetical protein
VARGEHELTLAGADDRRAWPRRGAGRSRADAGRRGVIGGPGGGVVRGEHELTLAGVG